MVCLSVAGAFVAGVHYVAVDLPQQQSMTAPKNAYDQDETDACFKQCNENNGNAILTRMCYLSCQARNGG